MIRDLNRNARVGIASLPIWSVFWGLVYFYSPLYMKELGLDEVAIGIVNTVSLLFAFLCFLIASPITNKLGRKRTTLIFDLLSWTAPMLLWAVSRNVWFFLAAGVINAFSKVTSISWNCIITEDEEKEKVPRIFAFVSLINSAIGVFAPFAGFFIARFGLVPSMRALYAIGAVCMTAMFVVRNSFLAETKAGARIMSGHGGDTILEGFRKYLRLLSRLRGDGKFLLLAVVFVATNFITTLNVFQVIFLAEELSFSRGAISIVPFAVAVANVAAFFLVAPRFGKRRSESALLAFIACNFAASLLFLAIPEKNLAAMLAVMAANGASNFLMAAYRESVFMNSQGEDEKADMYAAVQTLTMLLCIPAGYLGGLLYRIGPRTPFALVSVLYLAAFAAAFAFSRMPCPIRAPSLHLPDDDGALQSDGRRATRALGVPERGRGLARRRDTPGADSARLRGGRRPR
jgi:MFS family permease